MSKVVVDLFEVIQVNHQHADAAAVAGRARHLIHQPRLKVAAVEDPGQPVAVSQLADAIHVAGILRGRGQNVGHRLQGLDVIGRNLAVPGAGAYQQADVFAKADQRQADLGMALRIARSGAAPGIARVGPIRVYVHAAAIVAG